MTEPKNKPAAAEDELDNKELAKEEQDGELPWDHPDQDPDTHPDPEILKKSAE